MKHLFIYLFIGLLSISCKGTYEVITVDNYINTRNDVFDVVVNEGYILVSETVYDSNRFVCEDYIFVNNDSLYIGLRRGIRYITAADVIPYIDTVFVDCKRNDIQHIVQNINKTELKVYNDEALTFLSVILIAIPFVSLIGYATFVP